MLQVQLRNERNARDVFSVLVKDVFDIVAYRNKNSLKSFTWFELRNKIFLSV